MPSYILSVRLWLKKMAREALQPISKAGPMPSRARDERRTPRKPVTLGKTAQALAMEADRIDLNSLVQRYHERNPELFDLAFRKRIKKICSTDSARAQPEARAGPHGHKQKKDLRHTP